MCGRRRGRWRPGRRHCCRASGCVRQGRFARQVESGDCPRRRSSRLGIEGGLRSTSEASGPRRCSRFTTATPPLEAWKKVVRPRRGHGAQGQLPGGSRRFDQPGACGSHRRTASGSWNQRHRCMGSPEQRPRERRLQSWGRSSRRFDISATTTRGTKRIWRCMAARGVSSRRP